MPNRSQIPNSVHAKQHSLKSLRSLQNTFAGTFLLIGTKEAMPKNNQMSKYVRKKKLNSDSVHTVSPLY